ncbi:hypothetical protein [Tumebacillus flagellatus]|uniref:Uncharacterized protein n=1 Tax=Tumebacillus flagellatus TaxID=1157490 RepID=A0A074LMY6_9BACL|nr:hypothetical protein [Tumebacillus flagellatus]KEO81885.1 hypothetical protein EL26_18790 [Tumebacillus flagellatus]
MKKAGWILISLLVLTAGATFGYTAYADKTPQFEEVHIPPHGWNPLTASDEELNFYNFPPRPHDPADLKDWERIVSNSTWDPNAPTQFKPSGIHGNLFKESN